MIGCTALCLAIGLSAPNLGQACRGDNLESFEQFIVSGTASSDPSIRRMALASVEFCRNRRVYDALIALIEKVPSEEDWALETLMTLPASIVLSRESFAGKSHTRHLAALEYSIRVHRPREYRHFAERKLLYGNWEERNAAARVLHGYNDPRSIPYLIKGLRDSQEWTRSVCMHTIRRVGTRVLMSKILPSLSDSCWAVRSTASHALGAWFAGTGDKRVTEALLGRLVVERNADVRLALLQNLKEVNVPSRTRTYSQSPLTASSESFHKLVRAALASPDAQVRGDALDCVPFIHEQDLIGAFLGSAPSSDEIRAAAVSFAQWPKALILDPKLQARRDEGSIELFLNVLCSKHSMDWLAYAHQHSRAKSDRIREAAVQVMLNMGSKRSLQVAKATAEDSDGEVRFVSFLLIEMHATREDRDLVIRHLEDPDRGVRCLSANILSKLFSGSKDVMVVEKIAKALVAETEAEVIGSQLRGLASIDRVRARPILAKYKSHPNSFVRFAAKAAD